MREVDVHSEITAPEDPDTYERMPLTFEVRYCESPHLFTNERPLEPDGAVVVDASNYHAALLTGPNFSCSNWLEGGD